MPVYPAIAADAIQRFLREHAIPATTARIAVMAALIEADRPLSVATIHGRVSARGHHLSHASVYRALARFEQAALAVQGWDDVDSGRMVYTRAPAAGAPGSCEFACGRCGRVVRVADKLLSQQFYYQAVQLGFDRQLASLRIAITCNACLDG